MRNDAWPSQVSVAIPFLSPSRQAGVSIEGPSGPRAKLRDRGTSSTCGLAGGGRRVRRCAWSARAGLRRAARRDPLRGRLGARRLRRLSRAARGLRRRAAGTPLDARARPARRLLRRALAGDADACAPAARRVGPRRLPRGARAEALPRRRAVPAPRGNRDREALERGVSSRLANRCQTPLARATTVRDRRRGV